MLASIVSHDGTMTIYINGKSYVVNKDHPNYTHIKSALGSKAKGIEQNIIKLMDVPKAVETISKGHAKVVNGEVLFNGKKMNNALTERILDYMRSGFPFEHMLRFLENIMLNPIEESKEALYIFLENKSLPITDDGCFLGYKNVTQDYLDWHSQTINNKVGMRVPLLPLGKVDSNRHKQCSFGYHVGTLGYIAGFHKERSKTVIVKVNPAHVVSVPSDAAAQKIRVRTYEVVADYKEDLNDVIYKSTGEKYVEEPKQQKLYVVNKKLLGTRGQICFWRECYDGLYEPLGKDEDVLTSIYGRRDKAQINIWVEHKHLIEPNNESLAKKPNGRNYYNYRVGGKFAKKA